MRYLHDEMAAKIPTSVLALPVDTQPRHVGRGRLTE